MPGKCQFWGDTPVHWVFCFATQDGKFVKSSPHRIPPTKEISDQTKVIYLLLTHLSCFFFLMSCQSLFFSFMKKMNWCIPADYNQEKGGENIYYQYQRIEYWSLEMLWQLRDYNKEVIKICSITIEMDTFLWKTH